MKKKKNQRKEKALQLNRETVVRLETANLKKAEGALYQYEYECTGCPSGCGIIE